MAFTEIQNAFLDGIEEVYSLMFTDRLMFSLLNEEETEVNVYGEAPKNKKYHDPISLIGRINTTFKHGEEPIEGMLIDAVITIPTKQLITHEIPHSSESDLDTLRKGKFVYDSFEYLVEEVKPKTLVADKWQLYDFLCRVDKKTSISR